MSGRKKILVTLGFALSLGLIASAVSVMAASYYYSRFQFDLLNVICSEVVEREPEARQSISAALKEYTNGNAAKEEAESGKDVLTALGYRISDFSGSAYVKNLLFVAAGLLAGVFLFAGTFWYRNKVETMRIRALADYLEQVNNGKAIILSASGEDDFSKLEDEIYKTVTFLYQTRDRAVQAKNDFAENLSNIAHQLKTPITAVSLTVQMMRRNFADSALSVCENGIANFRDVKFWDVCGNHLGQIEKQIGRLTRLEEALLVLSRIDAGTILLHKDETDIFTMLALAADNLQELFAGSGTAVDIPELGEMMAVVDLEWTMEAVMNLMKNCLEHSHGGTVHCSYAQNPLYTEIFIWDEGEGFAKEDLPHLFERFYRGKNAGEGGIGIGLALSKEIIERQNGTIRAKNKPDGGALFEIRFYRI